jgi:ATP-binding protein involved in chromosome partitioning
MTGRNIIDDGVVTKIDIDEKGAVRMALEFAGGARGDCEAALEAAKRAVGAVRGVASVSAVASAHRPGVAPRAPAGHDNPLGFKKKRQIETAAETLAGVKTMIAVASGKGGVGKSTIAANLAVAMSRMGLKTGFLDADIYGPSAPMLFGLREKARAHDGKIAPFEAYGVQVMSIGLIVDPDQALAWRGPMVMGALRQLMRDVDWGELDMLIVDTPPGTGDAHLSLIQSKRLDGAVIVSTPQDMALADMRRGVELFRKTHIPVIGVIENMAWLEDANGARQFLFGKGGAELAAHEIGAPFLGAIPIIPELRAASDAGTPLGANHPCAMLFEGLARKIARSIRPRP